MFKVNNTFSFPSQDIDECKSLSLCKNNGTCVNEHGSYTCNCNAGFIGNLCEKGNVKTQNVVLV